MRATCPFSFLSDSSVQAVNGSEIINLFFLSSFVWNKNDF